MDLKWQSWETCDAKYIITSDKSNKGIFYHYFPTFHEEA
jgi:hypothetical protein